MFGASSGRFYRSPDGGITAEPIGVGTLPSETNLYRKAFAEGDVVAAWLTDGYLRGSAYFSRNNGETWTGGTVPFAYVDDFAAIGDTLVFATVSEYLSVGFGPLRVLWSADDGATWVSQPLDANPIGSEGQFSRSLFVDRGALYAATTFGLYRATHGAEDWVLVTDGDLSGGGGRLNMYNSAVSDGAAYVSQGGGCGSFLPGVYRRFPGQTDWTRRSVEALVGASTSLCYAMNGLAASGDTVVQVLQFPRSIITPGVPVSFDRGETWSLVGAGLPFISDQGVQASYPFSANGTIYIYAARCETSPCSFSLYRLVPSLSTAAEPEPPSALFRIWPNPVQDVLTVALQRDGVGLRL